MALRVHLELGKEQSKAGFRALKLSTEKMRCGSGAATKECFTLSTCKE